MGEVWRIAVVESFNKFLGKVITFLPNLLAMITILILGWIIAWVVKKVLLLFLRAVQFDRMSDRWGLTSLITQRGITRSPGNLLSSFFYWVILLVTLILGINALEVAATQHVISQFFNYLPHLFAAIILLVLGYLMAIFLGQAILISAVNAQMESAKFIARSVRWFIIILSWTMALYHLRIAEKVVVAAFSITFGGIVLALAIAFGWGGKDLAKEFLERQYRRKREDESGRDRLSHL